MQNNTTGASVYDLGKLIQADSVAEVNTALKASEEKQQQSKQQELQGQQQMQEQQIQSQQEIEKLKLDSAAAEKEKDRQRDILVAEIRAAGYGSMVDVNKNEESDYVDAMKEIRQSEQYQEQTQLQRDRESNENMRHSQKISLEERKLQAQQDVADKQLEIARINKNKFDKPKNEERKK